MLKKLIPLIVYIICLLLLPSAIVHAYSGYGRITSAHAYLYKSASNIIDGNVVCTLEETYFVEITLDYSEDFYKVLYSGVSGYAKKSDITLVSSTPTKPYPNCTLTSINSKCYLRKTPKADDDNIVTVVPENCSDLKYIGKIYGEEAIDYQGNVWYFVSYFGVQGYIYSKYIKSMTSIAINSEVVETPADYQTRIPTPLTNIDCAIIIAILTLPIIIIVILMYRKPKPKTVHYARKLKKTKTVDLDSLL